MNPLRLLARNYRTFAELDLELPAGCVAIVGDNGAGKSSIANVVDLALFGPDGRSWAPYLTQGEASLVLELELVFEHRGHEYRVRRTYSAAGRGKATLDLEEGDGGISDHDGRWLPSSDWRPLTRESIDATESALEELLGLNRATFRASSFLAQGDGAAFTEAKPADRKRILAEVLGLDRFDRYLGLARRDRREAERELEQIAGRLQPAEAEIAGLEETDKALDAVNVALAEAELAIGVVEERAQTATRELEELQAQAAERERRRAALAEAVGRLRPFEQRAQDAADAARELQIAREETDTLTTPGQMRELEERERELIGKVEAYRAACIAHDQAKAELERKTLERNAILGRASELNEKAYAKREQAQALLDHRQSDATCDRCGQTLGEEARASAVASLKAEADELDAGAKDLDRQAAAIELPEVPVQPPRDETLEQELAQARAQIRQATEAELRRSRLEGRIQALQERIARRPSDAELTALQEAVEAATAALDELPEVAGEAFETKRSEAVRESTALAELRRRAETLRANKARLEAMLERLRRLEQDVAGGRARRDELQAQVDRLAVLERAFGRDGIPALIIGHAAIPSIEAEAGRILAELGTSYRVELQTERALAGGGTADALDVVVFTADGQRPYETFSGGERTRLNLALRIALARLLAARRGAESRLLVIDEPEFLDGPGTAALATVLRGLLGDFARVLLISHVPDLRDAFDVALEVVKVNDRSEVRAA